MSPASKKQKRAPRADRRADSSVDLTRLLDIVGAFPRQTICVVGDFVLDEFVSGEISRVSREAPVLILRRRASEIYPGGAANAVNNLADLGARVVPVGVVGDDEGGRALLDYFRRKRVDTSRILRVRGWIDHDENALSRRLDAHHRAASSARRPRAGGSITRAASRNRSPARRGPPRGGRMPCSSPIMVWARRRLRWCAGLARNASRSIRAFACSNIASGRDRRHAERAGDRSRLSGANRHGSRKAGRTWAARAAAIWALKSLVVTRGKDGMAVFERDAGSPRGTFPIYGSDAPVDVTGAGDTVIAVFTLALAAGASWLEAAHLANYAGGIVVMKRRTATVTRAELEAALRREATAQR